MARGKSLTSCCCKWRDTAELWDREGTEGAEMVGRAHFCLLQGFLLSPQPALMSSPEDSRGAGLLPAWLSSRFSVMLGT